MAHAQAVSRPEIFADADEYRFDETREAPCSVHHLIDPGLTAWAISQGVRYLIPSREGAHFMRLSERVFLISLTGGQPLHDDRHLADIDDAAGVSEHTWNFVLDGRDQMLLCEVAPDIYEHFELSEGAFIYMNTMNRHLVSRKDPAAAAYLIQVCGYGPDEGQNALRDIIQTLNNRPLPQAL